MYVNIDAALLWIIMLAEYLVNSCNLTRSKGESYFLFRKYQKGKLEIVMSVHGDDVFMDSKPEKLKVIKEMIKKNFNIS